MTNEVGMTREKQKLVRRERDHLVTLPVTVSLTSYFPWLRDDVALVERIVSGHFSGFAWIMIMTALVYGGYVRGWGVVEKGDVDE
ncbi:uncharacterized protein F4807DRAFT_429952 [Annulohypoxylon truncatum]|uniref:uncharacterized protein n=1 Tax=Annulohypoxylon truncatum TaxID=327061 RepID=UPI002008A650|nr:uncharacterized protein F4807DRAFT_429952 [Annulohypoxylon truncatum]KAI1208522.1 hypothetical protein F4807DRAFT_429952 [Annulohypoxylon truncatum]